MSRIITFTNGPFIGLIGWEPVDDPDQTVVTEPDITIFIPSVDNFNPMNSYNYPNKTALTKQGLFDLIRSLIINSYVHHNNDLWSSLQFRQSVVNGIFHTNHPDTKSRFLSDVVEWNFPGIDPNRLGLKSCRYDPSKKIVMVDQMVF